MESPLRSTLGPLASWQTWVAIGLPALTIVLGLQMLRALLPLTVYVLRDRMGWDPYQVGILAFAIFATGFAAGPLSRLLGVSRMVLVTAGGLALLRLAAQTWQGDPLGDLYLTIAGVVLFVLFLSSYLSYARGQGGQATGYYGLALLLGLALDTAIMGAFGTWDIFWHESATALAVAVVLVAGQLACLIITFSWRGRDNFWTARMPEDGLGWRQIAPWLAIGPLLFLQLLVFQNVARLGALTAWEMPVAFVWIAFSNAAGLMAAAWMLGQRQIPTWHIAALLGVVLVVTLSFEKRDAVVTAITLLAGQVSVAVLITLVLVSLGSGSGNHGVGRTTVTHGMAMIVLIALFFGYYVGFDLKVPYDRAILLPIAGVIIGIAALGAGRTPWGRSRSHGTNWAPALLGSGLIVVPLVMLLTWDTPGLASSDSRTVREIRVMSYNLHNGFSTDGMLNMESIAQVIDKEKPDVLGLQEVSRGWAINGSVDMLAWLSYRLQMPYLYGPTAGPLWGNALLTRYPVQEFQEVDLPPTDLRLPRGFLWARLDLGQGGELEVINTHYHHKQEDGDIRLGQSEALLAFSGTTERTVVMGDLNARPHEPEIKMLLENGLADVLDEVVPGYTSSSDNPVKRIDYILVGQGLVASDPKIPTSIASDHLPIVATVTPR